MPPFAPSHRATMVAAATEALATRRASAFRNLGEARCRVHTEAALAALEQDLGNIENSAREAMRAAAIALVDELVPQRLSFSDLRFFAGKLRELALAAAPEDRRQAVESWCYEHLAICTTHFMVKRDDMMQRQAAKRDVERFERQLNELQIALDDKTQLLEMIRQASTPIAPVVRGILVVPLVGSFDQFRAGLLQERLLDEIARSKARVAILDISGVPMFDTTAAQLIIRLSRSARLLGAQVFLVGMSAEGARTIVDLGIELDDLTTLGTLQDGLARALATRRLKIVAID